MRVAAESANGGEVSVNGEEKLLHSFCMMSRLAGSAPYFI